MNKNVSAQPIRKNLAALQCPSEKGKSLIPSISPNNTKKEAAGRNQLLQQPNHHLLIERQ